MALNYEIVGNDMQMVIIKLSQGETVIAEAGVMNYMTNGVTFNVKASDGAKSPLGIVGNLFRAGKRVLANESFFLTHFTNATSKTQEVAFSAPYPGKIIPVNLSRDTLNGVLICQKDAFLCAEYGTKIDITFTKRFGVGLFGGEGFVLEKLSGDGMVFVHACGTIIEKELHNETLTVDAGCIVGFEESIDYSVKPVGGLKSVMFGGEGMFFATLSGSGRVYLQSLPFSRLADRIISAIPKNSD